jgi:hypothetical protein
MKTFSYVACRVAAFVLIFLSVTVAFGQTTSPKASSPSIIPGEGGKKSSDDDQTPLTTFEEELRAKRAIKMAEKDHEENLSRAREIQQLGKELKESLQGKTALDRDCLKKIERLEKLTKKVRGEAGGEDEDITIVNPPTDLISAGSRIAETAESLSKEVKDTPRQVVSASVISSANVLLELIKLARTFGRLQP